MGEASRLAVGDRIRDYRIEAVLDRGARWDVLAATHLVLPRRVTIRVAASPSIGVRLLREACIVEALGHAGVPRLHDCGVLPDKRPWVAIEPVPGRPLAETLGAGAKPPAAVAAVVRDVAAVLAHAHGIGVVHRAVGPDTIALTDGTRGWPVVLGDWSRARTLDAAPEPARRGPHEAPEVALGTPHTGAVDVFALGVVAYELLTGTQLFDGAPPLTVGVRRYLERRGTMSPATEQLAELVDAMLAPDPAARATATAVHGQASLVATELERELADSAALAVAMLAVEEIALTDEPADTVVLDPAAGDADEPVEVIALPERPTQRIHPSPASSGRFVTRPPSAPPTAPDTVTDTVAEGAAVARIRKPRWTPAFGRFSSEQSTQVAGEIDPDSRLPKD